MIEYMGAFAEAFGYTPDEYRALRYSDWIALKAYLDRRAEAMSRGAR